MAAHEYDPDDNFDQAFHAQAGIDDDDALLAGSDVRERTRHVQLVGVGNRNEGRFDKARSIGIGDIDHLQALGRGGERVAELHQHRAWIIDGHGAHEDVDARVRELKSTIEKTDSDWDREKLQERLAKLAGGVCVIKVGAHTEVELKEKKHRIEDAISATRAAIEEGIVAGGGSALVHAAAVLAGGLGQTGDERAGVRIVEKAVVEPLRWIAENGGEPGYVIVAKVAELSPGNGYNAATGEYGDLVAQGVIDPVKVTRSALANAASIASLLLTTATAVVEKPADHEAAHSPGHRH